MRADSGINADDPLAAGVLPFGDRGQQLHRREVGRHASRSHRGRREGRGSPAARDGRHHVPRDGRVEALASNRLEPRDELSGEIEQPRLQRAPGRRGTVKGGRQRLTVRRLERVPVVTAVAPAGEPVQTPGSREVPADLVDRTRVPRHDVDPHPPPQHRIERDDKVRVIIAGITGRDERPVTSSSRRGAASSNAARRGGSPRP